MLGLIRFKKHNNFFEFNFIIFFIFIELIVNNEKINSFLNLNFLDEFFSYKMIGIFNNNLLNFFGFFLIFYLIDSKKRNFSVFYNFFFFL